MVPLKFQSDWKSLNLNRRALRLCELCKLTIIGSDYGLLPGRPQAIIWTIAGILAIGLLGTNFSENLIGIQTFSFMKMHFKMSSAKWHPFVSVSLCWIVLPNHIKSLLWRPYGEPWCPNLYSDPVPSFISYPFKLQPLPWTQTTLSQKFLVHFVCLCLFMSKAHAII